MDHFGLNWYENQKRKKEDQYQKGQLSILNRNLQRILQKIEREIEKERYKKQEQHINRSLVQSHIWNLGYANNFESKNVALEQGIFIFLILHCEETIKERYYFERELDRYMTQLGHIDFSFAGEFYRRKQMVMRMAKEENGLNRVY